MSEKCDLSYCDNNGGHHLSKYIQVCEWHWFQIMNRLIKLPDSEIDKLVKLEEEREKKRV